MAHWAEHYIMDGVAGVLPDIALAGGVVISRGRRLNNTSMAIRWHGYLHSYVFCLLVAVLSVVCHSRLSGIILRHLLLDYLTHDRNWLRYGHTKLHRQ